MPSAIYDAADTYGAKNLLVQWCTDTGVWVGQGVSPIGNYTIEVEGYREYASRRSFFGIVDPDSKDINVRLNSAEFDGLIEMNVLTADFDQLWKNHAVRVFVISCDEQGAPFYTKMKPPLPF